MKSKKHSSLYRYIAELQNDRPWGTMLDAGTGVNSLNWVQSLNTERWTAVTGSQSEADWVRKDISAIPRPQDRIEQGNWSNPQFLKNEVYDTVLADYLLGAIEGFTPYFQPYLFPRLRPLTRNVLYVTGLEPYVPTSKPDTEAGRLIWDIGRFRDACVLLSGNMPYREYPAQWVVDHLQASGFKVRHVKHFNIGYKSVFANAQIDIALRGVKTLTDKALAQSLITHGESLRARALDFIQKEGALRSCRNYVIATEPV